MEIEKSIEKEAVELLKFEDQTLIVNDDVRFGYELKYMKRLGFKLCSIICPVEVRAERARVQGLDFIENHQSETEIPQLLYKADFVLTRGEMSMEELGVAADDILQKIKVQS